MLITNISIISRKISTRNINVTLEQMKAWENGMLIQDAMPNISASEREFIITGITDEEWNENFPCTEKTGSWCMKDLPGDIEPLSESDIDILRMMNHHAQCKEVSLFIAYGVINTINWFHDEMRGGYSYPSQDDAYNILPLDIHAIY